jgi:hypothetical protein
MAVAVTDVVRRLGLDLCLTHQTAVDICHCARPAHHSVASEAMRRYASLMLKGKTHPFPEAGGALIGAQEGPEALQQAIAGAAVERVPMASLVATQSVTPTHLGHLLRGTAPAPRTGNSDLESADHPTVVRVGPHAVLADGHHRAAAAWAHGATSLKARVVTGITPTFQNADGLLLKP